MENPTEKTQAGPLCYGDLLAEVINLRQTVENHECALKAMDDVNAGLRLACEDWVKIANSGANKLNAKVKECDQLRTALSAYVNADEWTKQLEDRAGAALAYAANQANKTDQQRRTTEP